MIDAFLLVLEDLPVELIGQASMADTCCVDAFDVKSLAAHVHGCLDLVVKLVYGQDDIDVDDMVKMT
jgi:hypothetical protein